MLFDEELKLGEDQAFLISIYPHASRFAFIQDQLYSYRHIRNNSAMQVLRQDPVKKLKQHTVVVDKIFEHWNKNGFSEKWGAELLSWALDFIVGDLTRENIAPEAKCAIANGLLNIVKSQGMDAYIGNMNKFGIDCYNKLKKVVKG